MRTEKELLELVLKELPVRLHSGICNVIDILRWDDELLFSEAESLRKIIIDNPTQDWLHNGAVYYFPKGELQPRIEYLKMLIEKYSDETEN